MAISTRQPYVNSFKPNTHKNVNLSIHGWPHVIEGGAITHLFKASGAVKVGDVVILDTGGLVKIATSGVPIGVVIGGIENGVPNLYDAGGTGHSFPDASLVFVAVSASIVTCVSGAAISLGDRLVVDSGTAGRVITGTVAGTLLGRALELAAGAAVNIKVLIALG